jgi:hypothetical protein
MPNHCECKLIIHAEGTELKAIKEQIKGPNGDIDFNKIRRMPESMNITSGNMVTRGIAYIRATDGDYEALDSILENGWAKEVYADFSKADARNELMKRFEEELKGRHLNADGSKSHLTHLEEAQMAVKNIEQYGFKDWYDWASAHWGTKWNAYCIETISENEIVFTTAWGPPYPVLETLSLMFPSVKLEIEYEVEGDPNCGVIEFANGEKEERLLPYPEGEVDQDNGWNGLLGPND